MSLGSSNLDDVGCECVATYNAMNALGNKQNLSDIINYYEQNGAMTNGYFGVNPDAVPGYFKHMGYKVKTSTDRSQVDKIGKKYSVIVISFWNKTIPTDKLHTVALIKQSDGTFVVYNDNWASNSPYLSIGEYLSTDRKVSTLIRITGIY